MTTRAIPTIAKAGQAWLANKLAVIAEGPYGPVWLTTPEGQAWTSETVRRASWVDFIDGLNQWSFWFTQTFKPPAAVEQRTGRNLIGKTAALRMGESLRGHVERTIGFRLGVFVVAEPHQTGAYHLHGLVGNGSIREDGLELAEETWRDQAGGYGLARVEKLTGDNALMYVSKYLTKQPPERVDWRYYGLN